MGGRIDLFPPQADYLTTAQATSAAARIIVSIRVVPQAARHRTSCRHETPLSPRVGDRARMGHDPGCVWRGPRDLQLV